MRLLDVVAIGQEADLGGVRFVACSLELWDGAVVARSTVLGDAWPADEAGARDRVPPYLMGTRLRDDVGTAYQRAGGGCGGSESWWTGDSRFFPAVPVAARRLWLGVGASDVEFEIELRHE